LLPLLFDWDEGNAGHVAGHGISPDEVEDALLDPERIGTAAYGVGDEARSATIGMTESGRILLVVTTRRRRRFRVVTAREATEREKRHYRRRRAQG
jgi:uncharacterized DUF497 family protein